MNYLGRIGAVSVVLFLSTYYAVSYYLHYGEIKLFEFSGDIVYLAMAWWGGLHFDKARVLTKELQKEHEVLKRYSSLDGLTGIANRRYFDESLEQEWNKAVERKDKLSLIMLDIDFFKKYNDTYGHLDGDHCLKLVAGTIDTIGTQFGAIAARYGGEEFAVILPETDRVRALEIAETIRFGIEELAIPHISSEIKDVLTISVGVSTCQPIRTLKPKDLIQLADIALYDSKRLGRNRVCECDYLFAS